MPVQLLDERDVRLDGVGRLVPATAPAASPSRPLDPAPVDGPNLLDEVIAARPNSPHPQGDEHEHPGDRQDDDQAADRHRQQLLDGRRLGRSAEARDRRSRGNVRPAEQGHEDIDEHGRDAEQEQDAAHGPIEGGCHAHDDQRAEGDADEDRDGGAGDRRERQRGRDDHDEQDERHRQPGRIPAPVEAVLGAKDRQASERQREDRRPDEDDRGTEGVREEPRPERLADQPADQGRRRQPRSSEREEARDRAFRDRQLSIGIAPEHCQAREQATGMGRHSRSDAVRQRGPRGRRRQDTGNRGDGD